MIFCGKTCSNIHTCSIENINFLWNMNHLFWIRKLSLMSECQLVTSVHTVASASVRSPIMCQVSCVSNVPFDAGEFMNHRCVPDQGSGTIILKIYLYIHSYSLYYLVCLHYIISFSQKWFKLQKYIFFPKKGELKCWLFGGIGPSDCM